MGDIYGDLRSPRPPERILRGMWEICGGYRGHIWGSKIGETPREEIEGVVGDMRAI